MTAKRSKPPAVPPPPETDFWQELRRWCYEQQRQQAVEILTQRGLVRWLKRRK